MMNEVYRICTVKIRKERRKTERQGEREGERKGQRGEAKDWRKGQLDSRARGVFNTCGIYVPNFRDTEGRVGKKLNDSNSE